LENKKALPFFDGFSGKSSWKTYERSSKLKILWRKSGNEQDEMKKMKDYELVSFFNKTTVENCKK